MFSLYDAPLHHEREWDAEMVPVSGFPYQRSRSTTADAGEISPDRLLGIRELSFVCIWHEYSL